MTKVFSFLVVLGILVSGCGDRTSITPPPSCAYIPTVSPGVWLYSNGVWVWRPSWLSDKPEEAPALSEIDAVEPDQHQFIPPGYKGPPPGWRVVIMWPGAFPCTASPNGVAVGYTDFQTTTIYVAWAFDRKPNKAMLPALSHEYTHAWVYQLTQDYALAMAAGHP